MLTLRRIVYVQENYSLNNTSYLIRKMEEVVHLVEDMLLNLSNPAILDGSTELEFSTQRDLILCF